MCSSSLDDLDWFHDFALRDIFLWLKSKPPKPSSATFLNPLPPVPFKINDSNHFTISHFASSHNSSLWPFWLVKSWLWWSCTTCPSRDQRLGWPLDFGPLTLYFVQLYDLDHPMAVDSICLMNLCCWMLTLPARLISIYIRLFQVLRFGARLV
jgi:hypothetical protein